MIFGEDNLTKIMIKQISDFFISYKMQIVIIFLSAFVLYFNTLFNDYSLDDQMVIYDNEYVTQGIDGIDDILTTDAFEGFFGKRGSKLISGGRYRPLSFITFAIEWEFFGQNPKVSHFINIFLFACLSVFIFVFLTLLFNTNNSNKWYFSFPFIASMLYAFHPIHTEVVANIKGRDEILCFLFAILSCIAFIAALKNTKTKYYVITIILFFLSLMSKENGITFLGVFVLIYYLKFSKFNIKDLFNKLLLPIVSASIFLFIRSKYTQTGVSEVSSEILNNPFSIASSSEKWATIFYSFFKYLKLLIFPIDLTHDYYYNQIPYKSFTDITVIISIVSVLGLCFFILKNIKNKSNKILFSILFFIITFSIVSNVFFTVGIIMNERFMFIPSLGFSIVCAFLFEKFYSKKNSTLLFSILGVILIGYGFKTIDRNKAWKDNLTLFGTDYHISTNSAKVATSYGGSLIDESDRIESLKKKNLILDSSIQVLNRAIKIYPTHSQSWLLLGNATMKRYNDPQKAIKIYKKSVQLRPNSFFDGEYNLGVMYYNIKEYDSALKYITTANKIKPNHNEAKEILTKTLSKLGRADEALGSIGNDLNSKASIALNTLDSKDYDKALSIANDILNSNPANATANYVKGIVLSKFKGQMNLGLPFLEKSIGKPETQSSWIENLAVAYGMTGRYKETIPLLEEVIKMNPNDPNPYFNLSTTYNILGDKQKAVYYQNLGQSKKQ